MKSLEPVTHEQVMERRSRIVQPRKRTDAGQSLVEFAMMLPMMLLLCLGVVEIGRAAFMSMRIGNAATAAVEYAAQSSVTAAPSNFPNIQAAAVNDANYSGLTASNVTPTHYCACDTGTGTSCNETGAAQLDCSTISCGTGQIVECINVKADVDFTPLFHYPALPSSFHAHGNATMRVRQ